jgi:hypothetical protein
MTTPFLGCATVDGFILPPGKIYAVSLPIALAIPALNAHPLYVHHSLPGTRKATTTSKWTVTESTTGFAVAKGATRGQAMANAEQVLLKFGNDGFLKAISDSRLISIRARLAAGKIDPETGT